MSLATQTNTHDWTDELELQMKYLGDCCRGYVWMFKRDIQKFARIAFWLRTTGITLGVLGGCIGVMAATLKADASDIMIGITSVFSFGTAFCQGFLTQNDYDEKISSLKRQISRYSGMANNIRRQLGLPRQERERAIDYHRWITASYDEMTQTCADATPATVEEYKAMCAITNLPFPDDTDKESNIGIYKGASSVKLTIKPDKPDGADDTEEKAVVPQIPRVPVNLAAVIDENDKDIVLSGNRFGTLKGQASLQEAFKYTDSHMRYEMERLQQHDS